MESAEQYLEFTRQVLSSPQVTPEIKQRVGEDFITHFKKVLEKQPYDVRAMIALGSFYQMVGMFNESLAVLLKAEEFSPLKQSVLSQIGVSYLELGENEKALMYLKKAYESAPQFSQSIHYYAYALIKTKDFNKARDVLITFAQSGEMVDGFVLDALIKANQGSIAIEVINATIATNPLYEKAYTDLISVYGALKDKKGMLDTLERMRKYDAFTATVVNLEQAILNAK